MGGAAVPPWTGEDFKGESAMKYEVVDRATLVARLGNAAHPQAGRNWYVIGPPLRRDTKGQIWACFNKHDAAQCAEAMEKSDEVN